MSDFNFIIKISYSLTAKLWPLIKFLNDIKTRPDFNLGFGATICCDCSFKKLLYIHCNLKDSQNYPSNCRTL